MSVIQQGKAKLQSRTNILIWIYAFSVFPFTRIGTHTFVRTGTELEKFTKIQGARKTVNWTPWLKVFGTRTINMNEGRRNIEQLLNLKVFIFLNPLSVSTLLDYGRIQSRRPGSHYSRFSNPNFENVTPVQFPMGKVVV
jgi:hypothetical protein